MRIEVIWTLVGLISLLGLDMLLGVALALKNGEFRWSELPRTLRTNVLPYLISLAGLGAAASFSPSAAGGDALAAFFLTFAAAYTTKIMADLGSKVARLFGVKA